jgi:nitrite reductase/ring-hydroxylating ferredoxin subunit
MSEPICSSAELQNGQQGVRFEIGESRQQAFVIRFADQVRAYANVCPHAFTELDWQPGDFFDQSGLYLVCATHGALFDPGSGVCVAGPCRGRSLQVIPAVERDGQVFLVS